MIYSTLFYKIYHRFVSALGKIVVNRKSNITEDDKQKMAELLAKGYYIILTGSNNHLSGVLVTLLSFLKTGKKTKYSHVLMNCDNIEDPADRNSYKFVEATGVGVHYSTFDEVFNCDDVCFLTPHGITNEEWTAIIDKLIECNGKPYDDLFDLSDSTHLSCVEVVLTALRSVDYMNHFQHFESLIEKTGNLIPEMFRNCTDFSVVFETE